jgi:hypothetical protein
LGGLLCFDGQHRHTFSLANDGEALRDVTAFVTSREHDQYRPTLFIEQRREYDDGMGGMVTATQTTTNLSLKSQPLER